MLFSLSSCFLVSAKAKKESPKEKIVIIGSSAAASGAMKTLTKPANLKKYNITCITKSTLAPYNTCRIYKLLEEKAQLSAMTLLEDDFFKKKNITYIGNDLVQSLDTKKNILLTKAGKTVFYDKLLIATGASAKITPEFEPHMTKGVFSYYTAEDVQSILSYIKENNVQTVAIAGCDITGLECATSIYNSKPQLKMILVNRRDHVLPKVVDKKAAAIVEESIKQKGVVLYNDSQVTACTVEDNKLKQISLNNTTDIPCDLLILTTGMKPNTEFLQNTPVETDQGFIVVDNTFKTSVNNIWAAGDVMVIKDDPIVRPGSLRKFGTARRQGSTAALNMTGKKTLYTPSIQLVGDTVFSCSYFSSGNFPLKENERELIAEGADYYYRFVLDQNNVMTSGFTLGEFNQGSLFRSYLNEKKPVSEKDLQKLLKK